MSRALPLLVLGESMRPALEHYQSGCTCPRVLQPLGGGWPRCVWVGVVQHVPDCAPRHPEEVRFVFAVHGPEALDLS